MTPAEVITFLRRYNEWRRGGDIEQPGPIAVGEAIDAAVEMIERMGRDLRLIAETDPVDAALDPQRAVRIARAALEELK